MSEGAGARLKKIRLEKGLSLEEVHKKTKIHLHILKAIEEDSLVNVNPVYIKGFLKIYCKFLGVEPRDYIANYREPQIAPVSSSQRGEKEKNALLASASLGLSLLKKINFKKVILIILAVVVAIFVLKGLFNLGKFIAAKRASIAASKETKSAAVATTQKKEKKAPEAVQQTTKVIPSSIVRLGISAKEDCWLQVKVDGKVAFKRVLKKGRFENWEAKDKIELSVGNAGAVVVEVNGQNIPSLGRKGQMIKNIMISREGLNIGR